MADTDMSQDGGPATKKAGNDTSDVYAAKIVQFKKPSERGAKVVHGIMEVLEGEYQGMKGFFQTSHGFVWGHHLGRANLMYNLRPGDVFLVQAAKKTVTAVYGTMNDAQEVPLIIKKCWLGHQSEEPQSAAGNVEFSAWLADRDISEYEFKKWINDRLDPIPYFPLPTDTYKAVVVSLIRESPKCEGAVVRITEDGVLWDLLVLVEREELYVCGVSVGAADLRMLLRPGDLVNVQVQFMTGKERQAKSKNYPKLEEKEINHSALIAYLGNDRPRSSSLQPKDSSELREFLDRLGITVEEFENMRTPLEEETADKPQTGTSSTSAAAAQGGGGPTSAMGAYCLPNILQIPPFSGTAMATFCPNLPQPSAIPPMGVDQLEQLARCSVVISRAIVVNMMKEQTGTVVNVGDIIETEDDVESAIKMGKWITEALIQKMQTHLQSKVKTKLGPNFGSILSTQKKQIEAAITALSSPNQPQQLQSNLGTGILGSGPGMGGPGFPQGDNMPTDLATQQLLEQQRIAQQLLENDTKGNRRRRRERTPELDLKELEEEKKMEPLELLRKYVTLKRRFRISSDNCVVFGEVRYPKDMRINYRISNGYELTGGPKEFYTMECLYFFAKNMDIDHSLYVRRALTDNLAVVRQQDREMLKEYLYSTVKLVPNIENIHISDLNPDMPGAVIGGIPQPRRREERTSRGNDHNSRGQDLKRDAGNIGDTQNQQRMSMENQPPRQPFVPMDPISAAIDIVSQKMAKIDPDQAKWGGDNNQQQPNTALEEWKAKNNFNNMNNQGGGRMDDGRRRSEGRREDRPRRSRSRERAGAQIMNRNINPFDSRDTMMNANPFNQPNNPFDQGQPGNQMNMNMNQPMNMNNMNNMNQQGHQRPNPMMGNAGNGNRQFNENAFDMSRLGPVPAPGGGGNNFPGMQLQNNGRPGGW